MKAVYPYKGIDQTMKGIRKQIIDSVPYCADRFSGFKSPVQLFEYLKSIVVYENDPDKEELLQSAHTLFEDNYWGVPGAGDCDCFSILAIASFIANEFTPAWIVLAGNSKVAPSHIYTMVEYKSQVNVFDLTEPFYNVERQYKYKQILPIRFFR